MTSNEAPPSKEVDSNLKVVRASIGLMYFFEGDGWTKEKLEGCIEPDSGAELYVRKSKSKRKFSLGTRYALANGPGPGPFWNYKKLISEIKHIETAYDLGLVIGDRVAQYVKDIQNDRYCPVFREHMLEQERRAALEYAEDIENDK
jgi:hypothetical protein